jgi:dTDP-4-amino-4,6-dideoxygalactose transaminase
MIRDHGSRQKYMNGVLGVNSRMDALQAVVLSARLRRLAAWNAARREAAALYNVLRSGLEDVLRPRTLEGNEHVWHLYVVRVPDRDRVLKELNAAGIGAGIHYPVPIYPSIRLTPALASLRYGDGAFPVAERTAARLLTLLLFAEITAEQQERVMCALAAALG